MGKYENAFKGIAIEIEENTKEYTMKYAITLLNNLVLKTPVLTGRARGGWIVSVNNPDDYVAKLVSKNGATAINNGTTRILNRYNKLTDSIFIQNNLPYIERLDTGWSQQAPAGMVRLSIRQTDVQFAYGNIS